MCLAPGEPLPDTTAEPMVACMYGTVAYLEALSPSGLVQESDSGWPPMASQLCWRAASKTPMELVWKVWSSK